MTLPPGAPTTGPTTNPQNIVYIILTDNNQYIKNLKAVVEGDELDNEQHYITMYFETINTDKQDTVEVLVTDILLITLITLVNDDTNELIDKEDMITNMDVDFKQEVQARLSLLLAVGYFDDIKRDNTDFPSDVAAFVDLLYPSPKDRSIIWTVLLATNLTPCPTSKTCPTSKACPKMNTLSIVLVSLLGVLLVAFGLCLRLRR